MYLIDMSFSPRRVVTAGGPIGSILGHLIFYGTIIDLTEVLESNVKICSDNKSIPLKIFDLIESTKDVNPDS